jgi:hypothetical protein
MKVVNSLLNGYLTCIGGFVTVLAAVQVSFESIKRFVTARKVKRVRKSYVTGKILVFEEIALSNAKKCLGTAARENQNCIGTIPFAKSRKNGPISELQQMRPPTTKSLAGPSMLFIG